jgi:putative Mg2+ transporter-C (MgtC) family protein
MDGVLDLESFKLVAIAGGLGGLIGIERELAGKPAGLRTHIFVGAASALLMILGSGIIESFQRADSSDVIRSDPLRIVQAIVIGISFLGAGTIVHQGGRDVEGLTTAASILLTAGMGIAVAIGRTWLAAEVAVFALLVLLVIGWLERGISRRRQPSGNDHTTAAHRPGQTAQRSS